MEKKLFNLCESLTIRELEERYELSMLTDVDLAAVAPKKCNNCSEPPPPPPTVPSEDC